MAVAKTILEATKEQNLAKALVGLIDRIHSNMH